MTKKRVIARIVAISILAVCVRYFERSPVVAQVISWQVFAAVSLTDILNKVVIRAPVPTNYNVDSSSTLPQVNFYCPETYHIHARDRWQSNYDVITSRSITSENNNLNRIDRHWRERGDGRD